MHTSIIARYSLRDCTLLIISHVIIFDAGICDQLDTNLFQLDNMNNLANILLDHVDKLI